MRPHRFGASTITRDSVSALHDVTVSYTMTFNDGSTATYTTPMYKTHRSITLSPPLGGYGPNNVSSIAIANVVYSAIARQAFTNRKRLLNGVPDGHTETNSTGTNYLAPIEDPGACGGWFYNTSQTGFYKNDCSTGSPGSYVSYTVAAHTDSSMISQSYADALSRIRGQAYANTHGTCTSSGPTINVTFEVTTSHATATNFMIYVNGSNISGPRGTAPQYVANPVAASFASNGSSTVEFRVSSGYMPVTAQLLGFWGTINGVVSGSSIFFYGVNLSTGQTVDLNIQ